MNESLPSLTSRARLGATLDLAFDLFTKQKHLENWWKPENGKVQIVSLDVRPERIFAYHWETSDKKSFEGRWMFEKIEKNKKLVFRHQLPKNFIDGWPAEVLTNIEFSLQGGKTEVNIVQTPIQALPKEIEVFQNGEPFNLGWDGKLHHLQAYLARIS